MSQPTTATTSTSTTILILGAGTLGTSTAYHLAQTPLGPAGRITVVDRDDPPSHAAALDLNRIVRTDYATHLYSALANEALHAWRWNLELQRFFHRSGWLVLGEGGDAAGLEAVRRVMRERGFDRSEDVGVGEVRGRWKVLGETELGRFGQAYFHSEVGWVEAREATGSLMRAAEQRGVRRVRGEVGGLVWDGGRGCVGGVWLEDGRRLMADKVVLAAGAWTSELLAPIEDELRMAEEDRLERQARATAVVSAYYRLSPEEARRLAKPDELPIVVYVRVGEVIPPSEEERLLKYNFSGMMIVNSVATKNGHTISVPTTPGHNQYDMPNKIKQEMEAALTSRLLPDLVQGKQAEHYRICWDSCTPTEDLLMCKHPHKRLSNLYLAVGGSFGGYK